MGDMPTMRQLYVMRHAERVDFTFGNSWISACFDKEDNYIRKNLNMPLSVPKRIGGPKEFHKDCPLTRVGLLQATLAGEAMKSCGVKFNHVFCSPSLRCLETCTNVLKASDQTHLPINIEPGLFEWLTWYSDGMPKWMSLEEFKANGFNVYMDYEPVMKVDDILRRRETSEEFYTRSFKVTSSILEKYSGNILFVAHAASLDTCSRQLIGKPPRDEMSMLTIVPKVTYTAVAVVELTSGPLWKLVEPPFPPMMHASNTSFELRCLLD